MINFSKIYTFTLARSVVEMAKFSKLLYGTKNLKVLYMELKNCNPKDPSFFF